MGRSFGPDHGCVLALFTQILRKHRFDFPRRPAADAYCYIDIGLQLGNDGAYTLTGGGDSQVAGTRSSRLRYFLDEKAIDPSGSLLRLSGWAAIAAAAPASQRIELFLAAPGEEHELSVYQMRRGDVLSADAGIAHEYCGFCTLVDLTGLRSPKYWLGLAVRHDASPRLVSYPGVPRRDDAELRAMLREMQEFANTGRLDEWRRLTRSFFLHEDLASLDPDPFSTRYREQQLELYCSLSGKPRYDSQSAEVIPHFVESFTDPRPFPYCTGHLEHIGNYLCESGAIFRTLGLKPGQSVLEYGAGTGFMATAMAATGLDVTAVDINEDCVRIIERLAEQRGLDITAYCGEFGEVPAGAGRYDCILFYESFHHCLDFEALLRRLHDLIAEGGKLLFGCEPIQHDFPKPWGLRLDGESVFQTACNSWLELGFREDFFRQLMQRTGWTLEKLQDRGALPVYIAREA